LSYECITSEAARYALQERLDEDPQFTLSISDPQVGSSAADEDTLVDGPIFDDDLALPAEALSRGLATDDGLQPAQDNSTDGVPGFDDEGNFVIHGGLDDDLTDDDADGETDPEPEFDDEDIAVVLPSENETDEPIITEPESDSELQDPSIILVHGAQLPIYNGKYYLDQPACRYVIVY
jgi:hypothetical protein